MVEVASSLPDTDRWAAPLQDMQPAFERRYHGLSRGEAENQFGGCSRSGA